MLPELLILGGLAGTIWLWWTELKSQPKTPQIYVSQPQPQLQQNTPYSPSTGANTEQVGVPQQGERNISFEIELPDWLKKQESEPDDPGDGRRDLKPQLNKTVDISIAKEGDYVGNPSGEWREIAFEDRHAHHGVHWYLRQTLVDPAGYMVARTASFPCKYSRSEVVAAWNARHGHKPLGQLRG